MMGPQKHHVLGPLECHAATVVANPQPCGAGLLQQDPQLATSAKSERQLVSSISEVFPVDTLHIDFFVVFGFL